MDHEPCGWADCGEPAIGMVSTSGLEDVWVCEQHMDEAILLDPDRDVWRFSDEGEGQATA